MILTSGEEEVGGVNDPRAVWMAVIAFVNQNIAVAGIFGSFSVLLTSVEARMGVGRELSTLAVSALTLASALCGPFVGVWATRFSLKLVMLVGAILGVLGFLILAFTTSYPLYILAFGLFLGPSMSVGTVTPPVLVTRWFVVNRGKALGLACAPIVIAIVPVGITVILQHYGVTVSYLCLAALASLSVVANLFIIESPAVAASVDASVAKPVVKPKGSMLHLLRSPRFLTRTLAYSCSSALTVFIGAHIVPMGKSWGFSAGESATLLSIECVSGIVGGFVMGWVADRLGGVRTLIIVSATQAFAFAMLSLNLGFVTSSVFIFLFGTQSAGCIPVFSVALAEAFGRENFARSFGLANLLNLPLATAAVPVGALIFKATGAYTDALLVGAGLLVIALLGNFITRRLRPLAVA